MSDRTGMAELTRKALGPLAEQAQGDPRKLAAVSSVALSAGEAERAYSLACEARRLAPGDPHIRAVTQPAITAGVPRWHFRIVKDHERNAAWNAAIVNAVTPDSLVLDVGAGTGLLAMMAVRAGAKSVVSCEMSPAVADAAGRIVAANGYSREIRIVPAHSRELTLEQMGGRADVFVSEIISNDVVGEDAINTVRDVMRRLVKPGGKVIPASAASRVALAWWQGAADKGLEEIDGFDLREFNALQAFPHQLKPDDPGLHLRSEAADLFRFDFQHVRFPDPKTRLDLVGDGGPINGVVQWIHVQLDEEVAYENRPGSTGRSCWACLFFPFAEAIEPPAGTAIPLGAEYSNNHLRLWQAEAVPAD